MAAAANVLTSKINVGNREDLSDLITRVAAESTPFITAIGEEKATSTTHEWQTETLAPPSLNNAQVEGDVIVTYDAPNLTTRIGNLCQIFRKTGSVAGTTEAVKSAGRSSDYNRQVILRGKELMRDMELTFTANQGTQLESGAIGRKCGGALAFMATNASRGSNGAPGGVAGTTVTNATNATSTRTWTEALLKSVMAQCFSNGATPSIVMMGGLLKQTASTFTGIAQQRRETGNKMAKIIAGADVYVSDYGDLQFVAHPYSFARDALFIDPEMWAVAKLRPVKETQLAVAGDAQQFMLLGEATLTCRNERGSGVAADLNA